MKFSIKDFFSKCDQIRSFLRIGQFAEDILNGKLYFLCSSYYCFHIFFIFDWISQIMFALVNVGKTYIYKVSQKRIILWHLNIHKRKGERAGHYELWPLDFHIKWLFLYNLLIQMVGDAPLNFIFITQCVYSLTWIF